MKQITYYNDWQKWVDYHIRYCKEKGIKPNFIALAVWCKNNPKTLVPS